MSRPPSLAQRQRAVEDFNARHAIGTLFWAYKGLKGENPVPCVLRAPAELLGGHTPVAWLDGVSGCIALTHLDPRQPEPAVAYTEDDDEAAVCDVCNQPINGPDLCATDLDLGTCHAACLEGAAVVDLETGDPMPDDTPVFAYRFDGQPIDTAEGEP
ncbi:MAG: hypothetical protein ACK4OJ_04185 [Brevundimonas sp.]